MNEQKKTEYDLQAEAFLARFGLALSVELTTPQRCPKWNPAENSLNRLCPNNRKSCRTVHGREYWVELKRPNGEALAFSYWAAYADSGHAEERRGESWWTVNRKRKHPTAYSVISTLSADSGTPETADDVVEEYGDMKPSRAHEIAEWGNKVRRFFTREELEALHDIV